MTLTQHSNPTENPSQKHGSSPASLHPADRGAIGTRGAPIAMLGVPIDNVTTAEAIALVEQMVASRRPHYLVTPNVDFLVQALHDVELRRILFEAHLVLCDGTPLVWASRWLGNPLRERVAGSDLVPLLIDIAAQKGYRLFFLGGSQDTALEAAAKLQLRYPQLIVAGHYSPPFQQLLEMNHEEIRTRIEAARPDLLFVCFGCPKQEKWIAMHYRSLGVPVSIGVGGTIDFLAGRLARAPLWMQRTGTEWIFRLLQEPRRLFHRYAKDCWYFARFLGAQWWRLRVRRKRSSTPAALIPRPRRGSEVRCPESLDASSIERDAAVWDQALAENGQLLLHLDTVKFIDSTGIGLLIRLRKRDASREPHLVLINPSSTVIRALQAMRLWPFFLTASNCAEAEAKLENCTSTGPAFLTAGASTALPTLTWQGEITAANADQVWNLTETYLRSHSGAGAELTLDLSEVSFIDSTAVGLMVRARKMALQRGARLTFTGLQPNVRNVVRLSSLEPYLLGSGTGT